MNWCLQVPLSLYLVLKPLTGWVGLFYIMFLEKEADPCGCPPHPYSRHRLAMPKPSTRAPDAGGSRRSVSHLHWQKAAAVSRIRVQAPLRVWCSQSLFTPDPDFFFFSAYLKSNECKIVPENSHVFNHPKFLQVKEDTTLNCGKLSQTVLTVYR